MKMAKASEVDRAEIKTLFLSIEDAIQIDNADTEALGRLVQLAWGVEPGVASGWRRVVHGYDVLLNHCCDLDAETLEWRPDIGALLANQSTTERLVSCGRAAIRALGLDSDHRSPYDVREAIKKLA